jgi:hypothetical protein
MLRVTLDQKLTTAITGSYPRPLWYDVNLRGQSFKAALGDSLFREQYLDAVAAVINIVRRELGLPEVRVRASDPGVYFASEANPNLRRSS